MTSTTILRSRGNKRRQLVGGSEPAVFSPFPAGRDGHPGWMVGRLVAGLGLLGVQGSAVGMRPLKKVGTTRVWTRVMSIRGDAGSDRHRPCREEAELWLLPVRASECAVFAIPRTPGHRRAISGLG